MIKQLDQEFDVLVIGGGITGAGIARDAAYHGLNTVLLEMQDFAYGTSSRSSKLVHGGLRYLENFEFSLVFEAVSERRILMNIAPHLVNPMGFLFPVYKGSRRGVFTVNLGMWLYDGLSLFRSPKIHRNLSKKDVQKEEPALLHRNLKGAPLYYDCSTDDARLTLETGIDAAQHGATVCTYTKVIGYIRDKKGRLCGVQVRDELTGEEREIKANAIINATGPWSDKTRLLGVDDKDQRLRPTKGIHIVVDSNKLSVNNAVVCFHPKDGRVLFAIPWGDRTYIGTTDTDFEGDPGEVAATKEDVFYLLEASNSYFPDSNLSNQDVISTWAGVRPLISEGSGEDESSVSREHDVRVRMDGLITIAGGKLTTYRRMAAEVVGEAIGWLRLTNKLPKINKKAETDIEPLPGAIGWPDDDDHSKIAKQILLRSKDEISTESALLLANTYGMCGLDIADIIAKDPSLGKVLVEGRHEVLAQVHYGVHKEFAVTIRDLLIRRTQIFFRNKEQGIACLSVVAENMALLLGWDSETKKKEIEAYKKEVKRSREWREE
jgi:glycerol-3-phosphate dehydrogenase